MNLLNSRVAANVPFCNSLNNNVQTVKENLLLGKDEGRKMKNMEEYMYQRKFYFFL